MTAGSQALTFHAESTLLPGFSFDTGLLPASGPAQASLQLSVGGKLTLDLTAIPADGKAMTAKDGKLALDMHVKMTGHLKAPVVSYDGDVPGLSNIDFAVQGSLPIKDIVLAANAADLGVDVPETKLPDIPLGSVPGKISLTVAAGSHVDTSLGATCLSTANGRATYAGATSTSGTLLLNAKVTVGEGPLSTSVDLPQITIPIPKTAGALSSEIDAKGASFDAEGACDASNAPAPVGATPPGSSGGDGNGGGTGGGGTGGGGTTTPPTPTASTASVELDGVPLTVGKITLWAPNPVDPREYDLFISVTGPDVPEGSDIAITVHQVGPTCGTAPYNDIVYRPQGDDQYGPAFTYSSGASAPTPFACGLNIGSLPTAKGLTLSGTYVGTMKALQSSDTRALTVAFSAVRDQ